MAFFSLLNELIKNPYIAYFDRDVHCLAENGPCFISLFHCYFAYIPGSASFLLVSDYIIYFVFTFHYWNVEKQIIFFQKELFRKWY